MESDSYASRSESSVDRLIYIFMTVLFQYVDKLDSIINDSYLYGIPELELLNFRLIFLKIIVYQILLSGVLWSLPSA